MSERAPIHDVDIIRAFVFSGQACFTLVSRKTGTRYTYLAQVSEDGERAYISVLTGPDNVLDYTYLATSFGGDVPRITKKSYRSSLSDVYRALAWFWRRVIINGEAPHRLGLEVWHEGRCGRCGRTLTVPESVAIGLGPVCAERVYGELQGSLW